MKEQLKYMHSFRDHNLDAPREIVPHLIKIFKPVSVVDVGCGIGTFLKCFIDNGVSEIVGIDGPWVDRTKLFIPEKHLMMMNLEERFSLDRRFDMALCLEVAEHLSESAADTLVNNLTTLSDLIIFSAATVNQGGQNHLNEQHVNYWIDKFSKEGFVFYDVFRRFFWNNSKVNWWYKQNMFLVMNQSIDVGSFNFNLPHFTDIQEYIHPELFDLQAKSLKGVKRKLDHIQQGKASRKLYAKIIKKKLLNRFFKK
ncbi:MAG: methyltransferase domain-containing protein [Ilyomonas sp.]